MEMAQLWRGLLGNGSVMAGTTWKWLSYGGTYVKMAQLWRGLRGNGSVMAGTTWKWLRYGGDYVEMQWDGRIFICKEVLLEFKMKNLKYMLLNYIQYVCIYIRFMYFM